MWRGVRRGTLRKLTLPYDYSLVYTFPYFKYVFDFTIKDNTLLNG
jgi:hypothetical protein